MTITADQFTNFATGSIAGGGGGVGTVLNTADTLLYLQTGQGALFPASGPFTVLIGSSVPGGTHELTQCTARASDTLTLIRGQEGTGQRQWGLNTTVQHGASASNFTHIWTQLSQGTYPSLNNEVVLPGGLSVAEGGGWTLVGSDNISTAGIGVIRVASAANVTGVNLRQGSWSGQFITLVNEGGFTITFNSATATGLVADGATSAMSARAARSFVWDGVAGLWYRVA